MRVLAVDWDLEAPGLHRYLRLSPRQGFDFNAGSHRPDLGFCDGRNHACNRVGLTQAAGWHEEYADITCYTAGLNWTFPGEGCLDFIPAGRQGPSYAPRVNAFNWRSLTVWVEERFLNR